MARILSVTFEASAQRHKPGQFTVPLAVCRLLKCTPGDSVHLTIESAQGRRTFTKHLASGTEIYGTDIAQHVGAGELICVTVSPVL